MRVTILALIIGVALTGCGLKGPLYLPSKTPAEKPPASAQSNKPDKRDSD